MTTLVGIHIPGVGTYFGSDRQLTINGMPMGPRIKWVRHNGWACGVAGHGRTLDLMERFKSDLLEIENPFDFTENVRAMMGEFDFGSDAAESGLGAPVYGQHFMLASRDGLWDIDMSLCAFKVPDNTLWACGSGQDYALGAAYLAPRLTDDPRDQLREMILAATKYDPSTGFEPYIDLVDIAHVTAPPAPKATRPRKRKSAVEV